ncbi:MAG: YitT family protein [Dialister sp.]|uniref:YitT family protein n=1 Tax=Dialister sp. TaxID=1955814 RepID=UPI0025E818FA|nr:YitT family protein [Dialister sp.]MEE0291197.1 YitT family protein [Dialister sp.]
MTIAGRDMDVVSIIRKILGLTIGAIIYSAGLNLFLIPNHIIDGGITGISLLVQALTGVPFSLLIVVLNLPFFYLGYRRLGAGLAVSSTYAIVVLSLFSSIFEEMKPATTDPFLSTIFGGIIIGIGVGIVIKSGGSTDGTEIVAIWMDNRTSFSVGEIIMFFNFFILGAAGFVFSWNSAMYSLIAYFICSRMIDAVSTGLDSSKGIFIVTTEYDKVSDAIVHDMHRAVTRLHGQGGFLKDDKDVLYCVVTRLEVTKLKQVVHGIDPSAFLSVFDVQEVQGGLVKGK